MKKYNRDVFVAFAFFAVVVSLLEQSYYISIRLISSFETTEVFLLNFVIYAMVFPVVTSGFAMWLFAKNNGLLFENRKYFIAALIVASVITYVLLLGKDETWMATGYWLSSVFSDPKMLLGLVVYTLLFCLSGYVVDRFKSSNTVA